MKFKIGDKVRSKIDNVDAGVYVGYIGTVLDYEPEIGLFPGQGMDWYYVEFTTKTIWLKANNLELSPDYLK